MKVIFAIVGSILILLSGVLSAKETGDYKLAVIALCYFIANIMIFTI